LNDDDEKDKVLSVMAGDAM